MGQALKRKGLVEMNDNRVVLVAPRPLTFEEFFDLFGEDDEVELIDGMAVKRMAAGYLHEDLDAWLIAVLRSYASAKELGIVLGSRTAVRITQHKGRLPDVLFVRKERADIIQEKGIYGAPDLVVEILSPGDELADIIALEADYRSIGVLEIWFIDQKGKRVRVVRKRGENYKEQVIDKGMIRSEVVEGFWLKVTWLFAKPLPSTLDVLMQILGSQGGEQHPI